MANLRTGARGRDTLSGSLGFDNRQGAGEPCHARGAAPEERGRAGFDSPPFDSPSAPPSG